MASGAYASCVVTAYQLLTMLMPQRVFPASFWSEPLLGLSQYVHALVCLTRGKISKDDGKTLCGSRAK